MFLVNGDYASHVTLRTLVLQSECETFVGGRTHNGQANDVERITIQYNSNKEQFLFPVHLER